MTSSAAKELLSWKRSVEVIVNNPRKLEDEAVVRFIAYDTDRSGYLEFEEIRNILNDFCAAHEITPMPMTELRRGFDEVDTNHDGKVSLKEFVPFVKEMFQVTLHYIERLLAENADSA